MLSKLALCLLYSVNGISFQLSAVVAMTKEQYEEAYITMKLSLRKLTAKGLPFDPCSVP